MYTQWVPPEPYPEEELTAATLTRAATESCRLYAGNWAAAQLSRDPDLMWQVITRAAHHMHLSARGQPVKHGDSRKIGKTMRVPEYGPGPHREGMPESLLVRRILRTHRHLLNLRGLALHPGHQQEAAEQQLLAALQQYGKNCQQVSLACSLVRNCLTPSNLTVALAITQEVLTAARQQEREGKRDKWHGWLVEQAGRGSGAVYRWIRDGPKTAPPMTAAKSEDGTWRHGKQQAVAVSDQAWWRPSRSPMTGFSTWRHCRLTPSTRA